MQRSSYVVAEILTVRIKARATQTSQKRQVLEKYPPLGAACNGNEEWPTKKEKKTKPKPQTLIKLSWQLQLANSILDKQNYLKIQQELRNHYQCSAVWAPHSRESLLRRSVRKTPSWGQGGMMGVSVWTGEGGRGGQRWILILSVIKHLFFLRKRKM